MNLKINLYLFYENNNTNNNLQYFATTTPTIDTIAVGVVTPPLMEHKHWQHIRDAQRTMKASAHNRRVSKSKPNESKRKVSKQKKIKVTIAINNSRSREQQQHAEATKKL